MIVRSRSPLRLGLAGGGTDVSPFTDIYGGYVLNATIDRYAYASLARTEDNSVRLEGTDTQQHFKGTSGRHIPLNGDLVLHKAVYNYVVHNYNHDEPLPIDLKTFCEAPPGSGLGSSSTLVVAMLRAFVEYLNVPIDDYLLAKTAYDIERKDCGFQGGRQDQYATAFGGFNFMEFYANERAVINPLRIKNWIITEFESSLLLYFTGISRDSSRIIASQSNSVAANKGGALDAMKELKEEALYMKENLLRGDFCGLAASFRRGWESKKRSAKLISNSCIEESYNAAIKSGAVAGKVSGAGGGGFMMFIVPPERRMNVVRELSKLNGIIVPAHFTKHGVQSWWL